MLGVRVEGLGVRVPVIPCLIRAFHAGMLKIQRCAIALLPHTVFHKCTDALLAHDDPAPLHSRAHSRCPHDAECVRKYGGKGEGGGG